MTRAYFTRTSVTVPSITRQFNSIPAKDLVSTPKEVFTSKINKALLWLSPNHRLQSNKGFLVRDRIGDSFVGEWVNIYSFPG